MLPTESQCLEMRKPSDGKILYVYTKVHKELMRGTQNALVFYLVNDTQRGSERYIVSPRGKMLPFFLNDG